MLNAITHVQKGIVGANPELPLSAKADDKWILERVGRAKKKLMSENKEGF